MVGSVRDAVVLASEKAPMMKAQQEPSAQEVLAGLVERVTFHNAENGFCVLRIKARGHRDLITVIPAHDKRSSTVSQRHTAIRSTIPRMKFSHATS